MSDDILRVEHLMMNFGGIKALKDVNLAVKRGSITALIGPNGAGKTTVFNCLTGFYSASGGHIELKTKRQRTNIIQVLGEPFQVADFVNQGEDISRRSSHYIASHGIAQSPEGRRVFPDMSVEENLLMGTIPVGMDYAEQDMQRMFQLFPRLLERRNQRAMTMSGGEQQMLAIARALMSRPQILLLDEPSLGLAPIVVKQIFQTLRDLAAEGMTIFLVEQNANHALKLSDRSYVMVTGEIRMTGTGQELLEDPQVRAAYLGGH